jgi:hypothetical protein
MAPKEIPPLRVWLLALVILVILAVLGALLFVVLDNPATFLAAHGGFGTFCGAVTALSFLSPLYAGASVQPIARE